MAKFPFFQRFRKEIIFLAILVVAAMGVLVGTGIAYKVGAVSGSRYEKLEILAKVLYLVENNYVREVDEKDLIYGAIDGMLATLDPHTAFLKPEFYKEMKVETQGKFSGIGIEITIKEGLGLTIVSPIEDTPAYRAGLKAGDRIVAIEDEPTRDFTLVEAVTRMRGHKGTKVRILIMREGFEQAKEFSIVRDTIRIKSVKFRQLEPDYGYIRVTNFQERTSYDLNKAIDALEQKSGGKIKGLVLDLRNNPGGLLDQAIKVADTFIAEGAIVITKGRNEKNVKVEHAHVRGTRADFPMMVLVNGGSASASEIVAGALQDNNRAVILGTQTFGKGTVQTVLDLDDGSGLKLTIARYFTPQEKDIQEKGISPDIIVEPVTPGEESESRRVLREKDLRGHLRNTQGDKKEEEKKDKISSRRKKGDPKKGEKGEEDALGGDVQLKAALDYLKTWEIFKLHEINKIKKAPTAKAINL